MSLADKTPLLMLIGVILIAGCVQEQEPVTELYVPGHGNQIYAFTNDIRESLLVKTNDPESIKDIGKSLVKLNIVFDGSNEQDNAYFRVVLVNLAAKLPTYYSYEGRLMYFDPYYFIGEKWYNSSSEEIQMPAFSEPVLWFSGPSTGANETSLTLENNTIYLRGESYKGLTLAGDKLALLFFQIDKI